MTTDLFSAVADPTRRRILELLAGRGQMSATEISDHFTVSAQAISQHLKVLLQANLVSVERRAQQRLYRLNLDAIAELEQWTVGLRERWNRRLDRLGQALKAARHESIPRSDGEGEAQE
jgi:DNA-binding transcriptional ArsR family regulator